MNQTLDRSPDLSFLSNSLTIIPAMLWNTEHTSKVKGGSNDLSHLLENAIKDSIKNINTAKELLLENENTILDYAEIIAFKSVVSELFMGLAEAKDRNSTPNNVFYELNLLLVKMDNYLELSRQLLQCDKKSHGCLGIDVKPILIASSKLVES